MYRFVYETYLSANLSKESLSKSLKFSAMMVCDIIGSADFFVQIVRGDFLGFVIPCSYEMV